MSNLEKVFNNDKQFEDFAAKHTLGYSDTEKALEIVKKFILSKDLIIYGGMAIDLALKVKGHKGIYKEDAVPDYDFMSPKHYEHACELADLLAKEGFSEAQAVNAVHVSTYKVRTNFVWVADITYIPMEVFRTIPTLKVGGMRIVHPDFQRLDMHRAMSTPLEKPPMEVFLHRAKKDQKRFRMLDELYPLSIGNVAGKGGSLQKWSVPIEWYHGNVIGGSQAYCIMYWVLKEILHGSSKLAKSIPADLKNTVAVKFKTLPEASFKVENGKLTFETFCSTKSLNIISDDFENTLSKVGKGGSKAIYYNKYVDDWRPRTLVIPGDMLVEIFDNKPRLLPVYRLASIGKMLGLTWPEIEVCSPQYVLMYYLQKYFGGSFTKEGKLDKQNDPTFLTMYLATKSIIEIAETMYTLLEDKGVKGNNEGDGPKSDGDGDKSSGPKNDGPKSDNKSAVNAVFAELPFFLTDHTYGSYNWSPDYIVGAREQNYFINHVPLYKQEIMKPPRGYYRKEPPAKFDPSKSAFFLFDGLECPPFKPIVLIQPYDLSTETNVIK